MVFRSRLNCGRNCVYLQVILLLLWTLYNKSKTCVTLQTTVEEKNTLFKSVKDNKIVFESQDNKIRFLNQSKTTKSTPTESTTDENALNPKSLDHLNLFIRTLKNDTDIALKWISSRIESHKEHWAKGPLASEPKKILVFPGFLAGSGAVTNEGFPRDSLKYHGGPLGEMVQWTDIVASLVALGHEVTLDVLCDQTARIR